MAKFSFGKVDVGLTAGMETGSEASAERSDSGGPFRIALLGDFSGRANRRSVKPLADRRPILVDRDNVDQILAKLGVSLQVAVTPDHGLRVPITFAELDDFQPDRLYRRVNVFRSFRELRQKLSHSSTFAAAAAELQASLPVQPKPAHPAAKPPVVSSENLLEQLLGGSTAPAAAPSESVRLPGGGDWNDFLRRVVAPHLGPSIDYDKQAELVALVDQMTSQQMAAILHQPDFQALEAIWTALFLLVRKLDTDSNLKLFLLDISREELAADLSASDDLSATAFYKEIVGKTIGTPGGQPWAVLAGAYTFGPSRDDAQLLGRLAKVAHKAGAPLLAGVHSSVFGCASLTDTTDPDDWKATPDPEGQEAWQALRQLPESAYLGLTAPRFLLRLPYGKDTNPTEQFAFEEMPERPRHEWYLWGNPAFACGYLLAESFSRYGWEMRSGMILDLTGLPMHVYREDGESQVKPCAEVVLGERAADVMANHGVMALMSVQNQDAVHLVRFLSAAWPARALAGRWR